MNDGDGEYDGKDDVRLGGEGEQLILEYEDVKSSGASLKANGDSGGVSAETRKTLRKLFMMIT